MASPRAPEDGEPAGQDVQYGQHRRSFHNQRIGLAVMRYLLCTLIWLALVGAAAQAADPPRPNIVLILADDLGYSDLGCFGSEIATPNLDRLADGGIRLTQFYNCARCCPTRAAVLTGLYPHQAGVGHMLQDWREPSYTSGIGENTATIAELLRAAGYRTYHVGKWHVGGVGNGPPGRNHPMRRGFDRAFGTGGGGGYFDLTPLYLDSEAVEPPADFYVTDAFTEHAVEFIGEHARRGERQPFFMHLCYTAPHFPLHAKPTDIAKYQDRYAAGWDALRGARLAKQRELGIVDPRWRLSPRDPVAQAWEAVPQPERDEWSRRMAVHAAMIDCMDQGIGRVLAALDRAQVTDNTLVIFLSDNGASAEALDTWPNPGRGHRPGSVVGERGSHRCLEIGWANAANTPFRECKMWTHEGGISTPFVARWPAGIAARGALSREVGHVIDLMPSLLELAGGAYPQEFQGRRLTPLAGISLVPALAGQSLGERTLGWEHEGNRALRSGNWKVVAPFRGAWELYDLAADRTETNNLAAAQPERVEQLAEQWQAWADRVGVIDWQELPGADYHPSSVYRKKSEPFETSSK
ncbi:MAG: arylsulfatase [Pirellulales bacterium]|nr:arylsulfatase [Pirellulales bacterium]